MRMKIGFGFIPRLIPSPYTRYPILLRRTNAIIVRENPPKLHYHRTIQLFAPQGEYCWCRPARQFLSFCIENFWLRYPGIPVRLLVVTEGIAGIQFLVFGWIAELRMRIYYQSQTTGLHRKRSFHWQSQERSQCLSCLSRLSFRLSPFFRFSQRSNGMMFGALRDKAIRSIYREPWSFSLLPHLILLSVYFCAYPKANL